MSAKSTPQHVSPLNHARGTALHAGSFVILAFALILGGVAWVLDRSDGAEAAIVSAAPPVAPAEAPTEPPVAALPVAQAVPASSTLPENSRYRALSEFLAKRYRVSQAVTHDLVTIAHAAGQQIGVDPLLIIAVMAVESRFNPIAESVAGAKGLMQIIPRYHTDKFRDFGGVKAVFDPEANIVVGSQIIKEYLARTGNLNSALQLYVGAATDQDRGYSGKVMTEKQRLMRVVGQSS
jgi:soluble lytic murein transglycosylase-like protein